MSGIKGISAGSDDTSGACRVAAAAGRSGGASPAGGLKAKFLKLAGCWNHIHGRTTDNIPSHERRLPVRSEGPMLGREYLTHYGYILMADLSVM
jgi:hypothetical protein